MAALSPSRFLKIVYRSLFIQGAWNYERMLSLGFCFCLIPFAKKYLRNNAERIQFLKRNLEFFNTHPYMASWVIGATIKLEEQALTVGQLDPAVIGKFKSRLSGPFGAIGDQLFWSQIKPITAMIGLMLTLYMNLIGVFGFLIFYNMPHIFGRIKGLYSGYQLGFDLVKIASLQKYRQLFDNLNRVGGLIAGASLILIGNSQYISSLAEVGSFLIGVFFMFFLVKWKFSIPLALIALILISVVLGGLFI